MQKELIRQRHEDLLKKEFRETFEDIEQMDMLSFERLLNALRLAEYYEEERADGARESERARTIREITDILCGPYRRSFRQRIREWLAA